MNTFRDILRQVFPKPEAVIEGKVPIISEPISRNDEFVANYVKWKENGKADRIKELVWMSKKTGYNLKNDHLHVGYYRDRGIEGLIIREISETSTKELRYLLDYLKDAVLHLNYRLYHGISESRENRGKVSTKEEYYLKPAIQGMKYPLNQEFGNIKIELNLLNDDFQYLKIISTTYSGFNYKEPLPFEELLEYFFYSDN